MDSDGAGGRQVSFMPHGLARVPTVLLCGSPLVSIGLSHILAGTCFHILEGAASAASQTTECPTGQVALILIHVGSRDALELIQQLKLENPGAKVAVLADRLNIEEITFAFKAGADGFSLSTAGREILTKHLELVMLGERVFPSVTVLEQISEMSPRTEPIQDTESDRAALEPLPQIRKLSDRELEILSWLKEGAQNKVIARNLDVTEGTVKVHVKAILKKLGAKNRTQAAMMAASHLP